MYWQVPDEDGMAMFGLTAEDYSAENAPVALWPENWLPYMVFSEMGTQWNVGPNGAVGLRYEVLPLVLRMNGVARSKWPECFVAVRVMEAAALETMRGS